MSQPLRIMIVDDSPVVRMGLNALLATEDGLDVVGEAGDGDRAVELAGQMDPDVVLLDVRMPTRDGVSVIADLASKATVIMMTFTDEAQTIQEALRRGASGYLVHGTFDAAFLGGMIRQCAAGAGAFSGPALAALRTRPAAPDSVESPSAGSADEPAAAGHQIGRGLSPRQVEVMDLIAQGRSNQQIAGELYLAEKTVKNHINAIFAELDVSSRGEAIVLWLDR